MGIEQLLKGKGRKSIYDIREEDFHRVKKIREDKKAVKLEDMDVLLEEIGDVDPYRLNSINQEFEQDLLRAEADTFWCLSKIIDDI